MKLPIIFAVVYFSLSFSNDLSALAGVVCDDPLLYDAVTTHNAVLLHWKKVEGVSEYQVAARAINSKTWVLFSTSLNSMEIHHLTPETNYEWGVRAICPISESTEWQGSGAFATAEGPREDSISDPLIASDGPIVTIYEDPVSACAIVEVFSRTRTDQVVVKITDALGNLIYRGNRNGPESLFEFKVNTKDFAPGIHHVSILAGQFLERRSLILQR